MKSKVALCLLVLIAPAHSQTPPTAREAFNLRIKCKQMVAQNEQDMQEQRDRLGKLAPELSSSFSSSRYDPRANRCYGEFHYHENVRRASLDREVRALYDMQVDDMLAFWEIKNGKKNGMVFDHSHLTTTNKNIGWMMPTPT
jgi:hypothetical protein